MRYMKFILISVITITAFSASSQAQTQSAEDNHSRSGWNQGADFMMQKPDSGLTQDHNRLLHLSVGVGTIENNNINVAFKAVHGIYITVSGGSTDLPDEERWFGRSVGYFVKGGVSWRISSDALTPVIGLEIGKVRLDVQESTQIVSVPNRADIGSILGGVEYRYDSGFNMGGRVGLGYSKILTKEAKYRIGFQLTAGWNF